MFESALIAFGLSPREAKVYLATLKLGEGSASVVAKHCDFPRLSAYSILERLCSMHVMTCYQRKRVRVYRAAAPEAFLKHCDEQVSSIQAKKERFRDVLPEIKSSFLNGHSGEMVDGGRIRFFEDRRLFEKICLEAVNDSPDWYVAHDGSLWNFFSKLVERAEVTPRLLLPFSQKSVLSKYVQGLEVRYVPDARLRGPVNFMIMGRHAMFILQEKETFLAVEVDHLSVTHMLKMFFLLLWDVDFFEE